MRKLLVAVLVGALFAVAAAQALASTRSVKVGDDYFVKKGTHPTITVRKGTRVRWEWSGDHTHNVAVKKGPAFFHSSFRSSGSYSHKMTRAGTYTIVCTIHSGMRMTLKVKR